MQAPPRVLQRLAFLFCMAWSFVDVQFTPVLLAQQTTGTHCGALALLHLAASVGVISAFDEGDAFRLQSLLLHSQPLMGCGPQDDAG